MHSIFCGILQSVWETLWITFLFFLRLVWSMCIYPTPLWPAEYDTRSIFQRNTTFLNTEFSFSYKSSCSNAKVPSLLYHLPGGRRDGFMPSLKGKQSHTGFELGSSIPFPVIITVTLNTPAFSRTQTLTPKDKSIVLLLKSFIVYSCAFLWFGFFVKWYINLPGLFNAKAVLEEQ